jgi:hypothetical protein
VWVRADAATLRARLDARRLSRDGQKLAGFDEFVAAVRAGVAPPVPHLAVDNRLGAPPLADQLDRLLRVVRRQPLIP